MAEFDDLIGPLLEREGGDKYTNRKGDRGGPTKFGVTQTEFSAWLSKHGKPYRDVSTITQDEAVKVYFEDYWTPANCAALPTVLREIQFDSAVQHNPRRAIILLQQAAGATQDGKFGAATLKAVFGMNPDLLLYRYIVMRYRFYGEIIARDPSQDTNIDGWLRRMRAFG